MAKRGIDRKRYMVLDYDRAMHWYNMGMNDREIAEKCDVGKNAVSLWRTRNLLPPNVARRKVNLKLTLLEWDSVQAREHGVTYGEWASPAFAEERSRLLKEKSCAEKEQPKVTTPGAKEQKKHPSLRGAKKHPVISTSDDGKETWYPSIMAAKNATTASASQIRTVCNSGKGKSGGYKWRYADAK